MPTTEKMECKNCVAFDPITKGVSNGYCRLNPPTNDGDARTIDFPPVVRPDDWCLQYFKKNK